MSVLENIKKTKLASSALHRLTTDQRNVVLSALAEKLQISSELIITANNKDLINFSKDDPRYDRLILNEARIKSMAESIELLAKMSDPFNELLEQKTMPNVLKQQMLVF